MTIFETIEKNPDTNFLLEFCQNFYNFYNFLHKNLSIIKLSESIQNDNSLKELSDIIINVPFLLNAQIPILIDDFLCYPIFYRHRQIIYDNKNKKYTTHYSQFLEKLFFRYTNLIKHFHLFLYHFQNNNYNISSFDGVSSFLSFDFQKRLNEDLDKLQNYLKNPPFDLNKYISENNENYITYLNNNSTTSTLKLTNDSFPSTLNITKN